MDAQQFDIVVEKTDKGFGIYFAKDESGFLGALLKVKSKIRAEIDGDEEELLREQLEDERFEKQWLEEFDALKKQYEQKWETCTYTADEFCGLLYRSSDVYQKEYLEQEYPTLMDAWKDGRAPSSSSRVIPEWPAVKKAYDSTVNYDPVDSSELVASSSTGSGANTRSIHCSQSLQSTLECLRVGFMWRSDDLRAFSRRLDAAGISSCSGLLEALDARSSHFERNFQCIEYPRLTKTLLRALRERAQNTVAAPSEGLLWPNETIASQLQNAAGNEKSMGEEEDWELAESGKDALIVLLDVRKAMFSPYPHATAEAPSTWFHAVVELVIKLLKSKVVANDNSLLSVVFFGTNKRREAGTLEQVYEFQPLGYPSAQRIKDLQALLETDIQSEFESMQNSEKLSFSNALWQCVFLTFSDFDYSLKKKDSQRIWIFTNDDSPEGPDADEVGRIQKQVQVISAHCKPHRIEAHTEPILHSPPGKENFDLAKFYGCSFKDFSAEEDEEMVDNEASFQPAFPVSSLDDLMDGSLRKRFRKRRLTTFPLHITKGVSIGVELYALVVVQRKNTPVALDASTNTPLKTETKWLCEDTGAYLTPDQIKKYIDYGGKRVASAHLLQAVELSQVERNIRSPYFVYPCDGYIEGSSTAFMAIQNSMFRKQKFALARLIARKTSEPRLVALVPQEEENDEMGQVQPSGFNVIFLPYLDDIRDIPVEAVTNELQKHYAAIQALALDEEALEFDEKKDTTLPDADGFGQDEVKRRMRRGLNRCIYYREAQIVCFRRAQVDDEEVSEGEGRLVEQTGGGGDVRQDGVGRALASNAIQKKTVAQLKAFLHAHSLSAVGRKAELIDASRQPAGQLTQNALRRIKTLRHPNILAYLDGTEVPNNGPVVIVTEHVMPLSEFLTALRMEYGANSEEFTMCVSWGLRSILMALQFINVDCKLLHGRLTPQSIFVTKGGDWKLGGFELTAEITSDGPSYIYTAFQQYVDVNYKSPALKQVVEFGAATGAKNGPVKLDPSASHMLPAMVQIGSSLSAEDFKAEVLPIIIKLFSCSDRAVRVQLLQMMEKFAVHFDAKLLSDSNLNNRVMKYFAKLQTKGAIPSFREGAERSLSSCASCWTSLNDCVPRVLYTARNGWQHSPSDSPLLLDVSITVREQAKTSIDIFMKKVMDEAAQMKIREELDAKERELKRSQARWPCGRCRDWSHPTTLK
ncbi:Ku70, bridge and pillars domain [Phytophthora cactorum]|nr:Ku70, bridge and pillars domain [Phytophthora cactorum]